MPQSRKLFIAHRHHAFNAVFFILLGLLSGFLALHHAAHADFFSTGLLFLVAGHCYAAHCAESTWFDFSEKRFYGTKVFFQPRQSFPIDTLIKISLVEEMVSIRYVTGPLYRVYVLDNADKSHFVTDRARLQQARDIAEKLRLALQLPVEEKLLKAGK
jgi:hypothetical protein